MARIQHAPVILYVRSKKGQLDGLVRHPCTKRYSGFEIARAIWIKFSARGMACRDEVIGE